MPKPNYAFEKRQRELAKKKKKEEKAQRKSASPNEPAPADEAPQFIDLLAETSELGKFKDSTDDEWQEYCELAATFMDLNAGARGGRAGRQLEEVGRAAFPALLNELRKLDFTTEDGLRRGDMIQKTLERISHGRNFGWAYTTEDKDAVYNQKAVKAWFKTWSTVGEDDEQWLGFTKQLPKAGEGDAAGGGDKKPDEGGGLDDF